jgi:pSer/pThr/pTyr-binding forkhead associated (FHA) protein
MAGKAFQLVVRSGPNPGKVFPIIKNEVIIGRDPACEVLIPDAEISRQHATVKLMPDGYVVEDLGSTNGTIVSGKKLEGQHLLRPGEIIALGEHVSLVFEAQPSMDPDATMASGIPVAQPARQAPRQAVASNAYTPQEPESVRPAKKGLSPILLILIIVAAVLCVCVIAGLIIDSMNLWCDLPVFSSIWPYC